MLNGNSSENLTLVALLAKSNDLVLGLIASEGEVTPELEEMMAELSLQKPQKVDAYHFCSEQLKAQAEFFRQKSRSFQLIAQRLEGAEETLKSRLKTLMTTFNTSELEGNQIRFKICNGPKKLVILDETEIPTDYRKVVLQVDQAKIKSDLSEGKQVAGCHLETTQTLRVYPNTKSIKGKSE